MTYLVTWRSSIVHEFKTSTITWCGYTKFMQYIKWEREPEKYAAEIRARVSVLSYMPDMPMCGNCLKVKNRVAKERPVDQSFGDAA